MASPTIDISQCGYTIYKFNLNKAPTSNKNNFIPIIVIELPITSKDLAGSPTGNYYIKNSLYQYGNNIMLSELGVDGLKTDAPFLGFPTWDYANDVTWLPFLREYEDDNFKISVTTDGSAHFLSLSIKVNGKVWITGRNNISYLTGTRGWEMFGYIMPYFFHFTDDVYSINGDPSGWATHYIQTTSNWQIGAQLSVSIEDHSKGFASVYGGSFMLSEGGAIYGGFTASDTSIRELLKKGQKVRKLNPDDPNDGGGDSNPGGGGGDGNIGGDTNSDDGLPTISALDSGLLTAYNPTVAELQSLGRFLWSDSFDVNTFKKLFNDPFDTLLGLSIIPISPNTSGSKNIMFGNLDSGVSAPVVANQWVTKDLGSVTLNEVWKGALDYAPSTSASIYLPFIGIRQLNINDVMGSTLHLIYKFDVLTGGCVAQIYINHNAIGNKDGGFSWTTNQGLVYEFMGQCAVNIPLASQDFTNTIRSAVSAVGMVAGASASIATGNPVLGIATATVASANLGMQANTPTVERSGHLSGSCAILGYNQPFLVVTRPHQCKPSRYYALRGVPSQVYTSKLSNCTGFTQITANNNIHCSGAQDSELQEIQNLLVSGVYFPDNKR